ncbi:MAG TPA: beta-propeller fold lactonase family protein [Solirubrobacterales bacterium]|nr:beta-propeller fold lactonase family protein [Solirubrobacterales bacterium]
MSVFSLVVCGALPCAAQASIVVGSDLSEAAAAPSQASSCAKAPAPCTSMLAGVKKGNAYLAVSPANGTVTAFDIKSGGPGTATFRLVWFDAAIAAKVLLAIGDGTGPTVNLPGPGTYEFPVDLPIKAGDHVGLDSSQSTAYGACQMGAYSYAFEPPLVDAESAVPQTTGSCELLVNAVVEPSATVVFGKGTVARATGKAKLALKLPGPGKLVLRGKGIKKVSRKIGRAGPLSLPLKISAKDRKKFENGGGLKLELSATFSPTGGSSATQTATVGFHLTGTATASARPHRQGIHIAVLGCVTGNREVANRRGCGTVPATSQEDVESPLAGAVALLPGTEGSSLYAVGNFNSAVTRLALGPGAGSIAYGACLTGNSFLRQCTNIPGAAANAVGSPVSSPTGAAISPDSHSLYVTSGDFHSATVAWFSRDPAGGELTYAGCLTGDQSAGPGGTGSCPLIPNATKEGYGSGLDEPSGVTISADGSHVYVTAGLDQSVAVFVRNPATSGLEFKQCLSSNRQAEQCTQVHGGNDVLDEVSAPLISADGKFLYTAAHRAGTVDSFAIDGSGGLRYLGCVTGIESSSLCGRGNGAAVGPYTLQAPNGLMESPDRRFVYVSTSYGSIVVLARNQTSGKLSFSSCISGFTSDRRHCTLVPKPRRLATGSPLYGVHTPILSRNGKVLFTAVRGEDGVTELRRNPRTGALTFLGCVTGNVSLSTAGHGVCTKLPFATRNGEASGFLKMAVLARGPGNLLYAAAPRDSTVSVLRPSSSGG